ncbi:MAG: hypothetical protein E4G96_10200 [Chrysiogenales bacterium]|nr:MAG: hypothetical protein E4G96_10200 [Chrysiogenales bacterium]
MRPCRPMKTEIITLKHLKKDGTIDPSVSDSITEHLLAGKQVLMPVDYIYGCISVDEQPLRDVIKRLGEEIHEPFVRVISTFKMLDDVAFIGKFEFDFLHRIWPGEMTVHVKDAKQPDRSLPVRMPRSRYTQDIIERAGVPILFNPLCDTGGNQVFRKKEIIRSLDGKIDFMLIIDELCREHTPPSIVDISNGTLVILEE